MTEDLPKAPVRVLKDGQGPVYAVQFTDDGKYCMSAGRDRTIRLWNPHRVDSEKRPLSQGEGPSLEQALMVKSYAGPHGYDILDVAIAKDNTRFASCGEDKVVFVWDVSSGKVVRRMQGHEQRVNSCCFDSKGSVLLTASYDKTVRAWDLRAHSRSPIQTLEGCRDSATSVAVTPGGDEIVVGSVDGRVRTYDLRAARVHEDDVHAPVTNASMSNDGNCLVVSCLGGAVRMLEKQSGAELNVYKGHTHSSYQLESCLSNTDAHVISGSEDGKVYVWDIVDAKVSRVLRYHKGAVCSLSFHPDDPVLLTASHDGTVVLWGDRDASTMS